MMYKENISYGNVREIAGEKKNWQRLKNKSDDPKKQKKFRLH